MKFCSECGHSVNLEIPESDDRPRFVCPNCKTIHYQNPKVVVGSLPVFENKVLLCKRAIEPRRGFWTLPAGFLENEETALEGAKRETWEEALGKLENASLYRLYDVPHIAQIYIFFLAELVDGEFGIGPESLECKLYEEHEIPWDEISFPVVKQTLEEFFQDRKSNNFPVRISTAIPLSAKEQGGS